MKAFDTASITTGSAHAVAALGYEVQGVYLRPDRCSKPMVEGIHMVGMKALSIWEKGQSTDVSFFTAGNADSGASAACAFAVQMGQPSGTPIFFAVDFDASAGDISGAITNYFQIVHTKLKGYGYLVGVYGSGLTCSTLIQAGWAHYGWLDQSRGHAGHSEYLPVADVVQGSSFQMFGWSCDEDTVNNQAVVW